jgi:hypothetical protein
VQQEVRLQEQKHEEELRQRKVIEKFNFASNTTGKTQELVKKVVEKVREKQAKAKEQVDKEVLEATGQVKRSIKLNMKQDLNKVETHETLHEQGKQRPPTPVLKNEDIPESGSSSEKTHRVKG